MTIQEFAELVERQQLDRMKQEFPDYPPGQAEHDYKTKVVPGRKYTKVDVGTSGKFMIDAEGNIFGIKGYGVIHKGHRYGNLATVEFWDWSAYEPVSRIAP